MHLLVNFFGGGWAGLVGAAFALVGLVLLSPRGGPTRRRGRWRPLGGMVLVAVGAVLVALSAMALPLWAYAVWGSAVGAWVVGRGRLAKRSTRTASAGWTATAVWAIAVVACLAAGAVQGWWMRTPDLRTLRDDPIYVIGDSLSAGLLTEDPNSAWPMRLGRRTGRRVVNLAVPGATLESARAQARRARREGAGTILLLIGGNDVLQGISADRFALDLERLLAELGPDAGAHACLFELPLLPLMSEYGLAQRRAGRRTGIAIVPRRILASLLADPPATVDGVHLSEQGHERLAEVVAELLGSPPRREQRDRR